MHASKGWFMGLRCYSHKTPKCLPKNILSIYKITAFRFNFDYSNYSKLAFTLILTFNL